MKLHRFFISTAPASAAASAVSSPAVQAFSTGAEITLSAPEHTSLIHQLKDVFRLHTGETLILLDNSGFEYVSQIVSLEKARATFRVTEARKNASSTPRTVVLYQAIPKKDVFENILQKGTELGVAEFVPVVSERSEKKAINEDRCQKILIEASEQSGRGMVPILRSVAPLQAVIEADLAADPEIQFIAFHPTGILFNLESFLEKISSSKKVRPDTKQKIGLLIGPEGGWSDKEIAFFDARQIPVFSMGTQILRAETAAVSAAGLFLLSF